MAGFRLRDYVNDDGTPKAGTHLMQPHTATSPSTPDADDYSRSNADYEALLQRYQQGIDVRNPDSIRQLAAAMQRDGIPAEVSADGLLIRVPGYDGGWVDPRQDKAYVEGRGDIRGWAFQPYYGSEDFDRLVAAGRNPHTGELALPGQQFSRDQDAPIAGPGAMAPGGMPPGFSTTGVNSLASFNAPGILAPYTQQFKAPTGTDDPGFQFALDKGMKALERAAAARGTILTTGHLADLADYTTGMALQGYDKAWNRAFDLYGMNRDTFWGNQSNAFNRLNAAAGLGAQAASQYGNNAADIAIGQGNVNAAAQVAGNNAQTGGIQNAVNTGLSVYDQIRQRRNPNQLGTFAPSDGRY